MRQAATAFPKDYTSLMTALGPGLYAGFVRVLAPSSPIRGWGIEEVCETFREDLGYLASRGESQPYNIDDLQPFAETIDGDRVYWVCHDVNPDAWTVAFNDARSPDWYPFTGGCVEWLVALVEGRHADLQIPPNQVRPDRGIEPPEVTG